VAYQCVNAAYQYFTIAAPNISVPPVTFSIWINATSFVNKNTALFLWRGTIHTGLLLRVASGNWQLRYYIAGGNQYLTSTGLAVSYGVWQHACVAITSTQARLYLGGASFTNNVSHGSTTINAAGDIARESIVDEGHTSFNGLVAEPAIWSAALSDAECLALAKRVSPLALTNRLSNLVMYRDMIRDLGRGFGPVLTPVNSPGVVAHPPLVYVRKGSRFTFAHHRFRAPYRIALAAAHANRVEQGGAEVAGAELGTTRPIGEVSS